MLERGGDPAKDLPDRLEWVGSGKDTATWRVTVDGRFLEVAR